MRASWTISADLSSFSSRPTTSRLAFLNRLNALTVRSMPFVRGWTATDIQTQSSAEKPSFARHFDRVPSVRHSNFRLLDTSVGGSNVSRIGSVFHQVQYSLSWDSLNRRILVSWFGA